jgi:hypothetical protein
LAQSLEEILHVQLNGTNRLLHQEEPRIAKGKVTLARESFVVDTVLVTERLLPEPLAGSGEGFIDPR